MITYKCRQTVDQIRAVSKGHAEGADHEKICAAASSIMQTLAAGLDNLINGSIQYDLADGSQDIRYKPNTDAATHDAILLFNTATLGFLQLRNAYPDSIKIIK